MPRKTVKAENVPVLLDVASMRPRPDAAENRDWYRPDDREFDTLQ